MNCFIFALLILSYLSYASTECVRLTASNVQADLHVPCLGLVDYPFYLPSVLILESLNSLAYNKLNNIAFSVLPIGCQISVKKAVCSSIYLKCPSAFNELDYATYNYDIFADINASFPLPFQRPCAKICENANNDCLGLLALFDSELDCFGRTDYSFGFYGSLNGISEYTFPHTYDKTNNQTKCNSMSAVIQVARAMEPYLYAKNGACSGIISSSIYAPAGMKP
jgi:hypothetical protein